MAHDLDIQCLQIQGLLFGTYNVHGYIRPAFFFAAKLIPVGYGIKKLQINAVIEDDKISTDDLEDKITGFEDYVSSYTRVTISYIKSFPFSLSILCCLYPRHLCQRVYSFCLSIRMFVLPSVAWNLRQSFTLKFLKRCISQQLLYMYYYMLIPDQPLIRIAFIFDKLVPCRVGFALSTTSEIRVHATRWDKGSKSRTSQNF